MHCWRTRRSSRWRSASPGRCCIWRRTGSRKTEHGSRLIGRFRQSDLADLLGTTTRSIITILNAWRAAEVVIYEAEKGLLTICKEDALQALISGEGPQPLA